MDDIARRQHELGVDFHHLESCFFSLEQRLVDIERSVLLGDEYQKHIASSRDANNSVIERIRSAQAAAGIRHAQAGSCNLSVRPSRAPSRVSRTSSRKPTGQACHTPAAGSLRSCMQSAGGTDGDNDSLAERLSVFVPARSAGSHAACEEKCSRE